MVCIYCKCDAPARGVEHVYPEGLGKHAWTLPRGVVCDSCNSYLRELDQALIAHPHICFALMTCDVPGKSGKPRERLGYMERGEEGLRLRAPARRIKSLQTKEKSIRIVVEAPAEFNEPRFHRALHKIAFNLLASEKGPDEALKQQYDPVRRYIRRPNKGERWPYFHRVLGMRDEMELRFHSVRGRGVVAYRLTLGVGEFFVDLVDPYALMRDITGTAVEAGDPIVYARSPDRSS